MKISLALISSALLLYSFGVEARADIVEIPTLSDFQSLFPDHQFEDFEDLTTSLFAVPIQGPINSGTNSSIGSDFGVEPGDIEVGLQIETGTVPGITDNVLITGPSFFFPSQTIIFNSLNTPGPQITVRFLDGDVRGFSLDIVDFTRTPGSDGDLVAVDVFSGNQLLSSSVVQGEFRSPVFFGGFDDQNLISRVELSSLANVPSFAVDNIRFSSVLAVPEPNASLIFGVVGLLSICRRQKA